MKISVVMPVCAYPTPSDTSGGCHPGLSRALDSVLAGGHSDFELLIGIDGDVPAVEKAIMSWGEMRRVPANQLRVFKFPFSGKWGNPQRNVLIHQATGDILCFQDQDDVFTDGALVELNRIAYRFPGQPLICRMEVHAFGANRCNPPVVLWYNQGEVKLGRIGGHMIVVPNFPHLFGSWTPNDFYAADFNFISITLSNFANAGIEAYWSELLLSRVRPNFAEASA